MTTESAKIDIPTDIWKLILNESKETYFEKLKKELMKKKETPDMGDYLRKVKSDFAETIQKYDKISVFYRKTDGHQINLYGYFLKYNNKRHEIHFVATNDIEKYKNEETSGYYFVELKLDLHLMVNIAVNHKEWGTYPMYHKAVVDTYRLSDKSRMLLTGSASREGTYTVKIPYDNDSSEDESDYESEEDED